MITYHPDYLYSTDLNSLNNQQIFKEILQTEAFIKSLFNNNDNVKTIYGSFSTSNYYRYNTFQFPLDETSKLYKELVNNIYPFLDKKQNYALQCWFNVFRKGENIDWHSHWLSEAKVWHGFYCVYTKNSFTEYKIPDVDEIIKIPSKEGRLVFGKSEGDKHKSSPWDDSNLPRITIAFDIIPYKTLKSENFETYMERSLIPFK
jgi:hypothetical protein